MQLAGDLSKISLPSLVQLVRNGGLTGEISLCQGAKTATIYVDTGRVVHVESDQGTGRDAFLELFLWLTGTFSFIEGMLGEIPRTIPRDEPMDKLLREGVAYLEQKKYLDQLRITGQTVLKPTQAAQQAKGALLLDRLDGRKTLAQALADANLSRRAYIQAVYRLLSDGLVVVCEPESAPEPDQVNLPGWVVARLKQDNSDLSQAIVDMVIWVDRVKCWMYQADADLDRLIEELSSDGEKAAIGPSLLDLGSGASAQAMAPEKPPGAPEKPQPAADEPAASDSAQGGKRPRPGRVETAPAAPKMANPTTMPPPSSIEF